jgi:lysophospholipase L1-like esterase
MVGTDAILLPALRALGIVNLYSGQVATRGGMLPNTRHASNKFMQCRTAHYARDNIDFLQVEYPNYIVATSSSSPTGTGQEVTSNGDFTIHVGLEYEDGTIAEFKWGGGALGTIPALSSGVSDVLNLPKRINEGDRFWLRPWVQAAGTIIYLNATSMVGGIEGPLGDGMVVGTTVGAVPDISQTAGAITGGVSPGSPINYYPSAIIATTRKRSVLAIGDSRCLGTFDTLDRTGNTGEICRGVGKRFAYINAGVSSDRATWWAVNNAQRLHLANYVSDVVIQLGVNDLRSGAGNRTAAQLTADIQTIVNAVKAQNPNVHVWIATVSPVSASSDSFVSTGNQTTDANDAARITYNGNVRGNTTTAITGVSGHIEIADHVENTRDAGKWQISTATNYFTGDGLHENQPGYLRIENARAVAVALGL